MMFRSPVLLSLVIINYKLLNITWIDSEFYECKL
jgi:hypothetical protein